MRPVYVPRSRQEKELQRALLQWHRPELRQLVEDGLRKAGRQDLIGWGDKCLLRPQKTIGRTGERQKKTASSTKAAHNGRATTEERKDDKKTGKRSDMYKQHNGPVSKRRIRKKHGG
jgi:hypothetical protein